MNANPKYAAVIERLEQENIFKAKWDSITGKKLIAPYKTKVIFHTGEIGVFGRDSLVVSERVETFGNKHQGNTPVIQCGSMVEVARCSILAGGEHLNDQVMNHTLDNWKFRCNPTSHIPHTAKGLVTIGSNVVISLNATILSGITIGDGAVIGAGAVVAKDVPPYAIVAGNPAKILRYRFDDNIIEDLLKIRWWDFKPETICEHLEDLYKLDDTDIRKKFLNFGEDTYVKENENYLVFRQAVGNKIDTVSFAGAEVDGTLIPFANLPVEFQFFMEQMVPKPDATIYYPTDIFNWSGLTA